ncbi:PepSY domain-containing protein [Ideonella aquatica]|nr:PepSY domain-containing protein [Ideonella aquatica]
MSKSLSTPMLLLTLLAAPLAALAGPACTSEPESKWIPEADMVKRFQALGYKDDVKKLHVSKGKCWEIYGHDKQGRKVEVYFHPISGAIAEENIKD